MRLRDFLCYKNIVIQCHDNPDADAIASGYGVCWYLKKNGIDARFVYGGQFPIKKSNLVLMLECLNIKIEHVNELERPELLIMVDCQYGGGNAARFEADNVAVIDHHRISGELPEQNLIKSNIGSCSTIIYDLLVSEGIDINNDETLATALYYGLLTDTNYFAELSHPLDRDVRDGLNFSRNDINRFRNSNLSIEELHIAGEALGNCITSENKRYGIVEAKPCDPNILGIISDMLLEVDSVDACLVYSILPFGVKMSVRSCIREVKASELAEYLAEGIGSAGGHSQKAGGFLQKELMERFKIEYTPEAVSKHINKLMRDYFENTEYIYAGEYRADMAETDIYRKNRIRLGYIDPADIGMLNEKVSIRTFEGDVDMVLDDTILIMIGIEGEVYPVYKEKFHEKYELSDEPYSYPGEYEPQIKDIQRGTNVKAVPFAKSCISTGTNRIYVRELNHRVKVFSNWDKNGYYLGRPGDYLAVSVDNPSDIYIIARNILEATYTKE